MQNRARAMSDIPAETELSKRISKALKAEGFRFVGPTTVYAFMQSAGMVNDHLVGCFRLCRVRQAAASEREVVTRDAKTSQAPTRAWQRMLSGRRLDLLNPSPADIEIEDIAHGLARVARWNGQTVGAHAFSVAQHALVVEDIARARNPDWPARWRLGGAAARCARVRRRRPHQPVQDGHRPRLQSLRVASTRRNPLALRHPVRAAERRSDAKSRRPTALPPTSRPPGWPASASEEATIYFGAAERVSGRHRQQALAAPRTLARRRGPGRISQSLSRFD